MNGKKARAIRSRAYGANFEKWRERTYSVVNVKQVHMNAEGMDEKRRESFIARGFNFMKKAVNGEAGEMIKDFLVFHTATIVSDPLRRRYKRMKKKYKLTPWHLRHQFIS